MASSEFLTFVNSSPSPFHAVCEISKRLLKANFVALDERQPWKLERNGLYFFKRNDSAIIAFTVGGKFDSSVGGFSSIGAHTDSPCLKLKPKSKKTKEGYLQVGVQTYGGGIWHTWFDRDLSVAGRVVVDRSTHFESKFVKIDRPILRIPNLAIHLDRSDAFQPNKETHLTPILATVQKTLIGDESKAAHHPVLLDFIAKELKCEANDIQDFELCLFDTQDAIIGGINNEFIFSPRLDNLMMSFISYKALVESLDSVPQDTHVRLIGLFDNEEVGSQTAHGEKAFRRIVASFPSHSATAFDEMIHRSYFISADMAHAVHPNYPEKHEDNHRPQLHNGTVIKVNANQRYATTSMTSFILKAIAKEKNIPLQEFVVRNDSPCGSTIGPMLSASLGMRVVDVGNPQLSMHSIREMCGTDDVDHAILLFKEFFRLFPTIDAKLR